MVLEKAAELASESNLPQAMAMTVFILSVAVALGVSFVCSLAEAALLSLSSSQIAKIGISHPRSAEAWGRLKKRIDRPISVILLLNTSAHTIGAAFAGASFDKLFGSEWIWLFSLIFTLVMLQFTEILPKSLGVRRNERLALSLHAPLEFLVASLSPAVNLLHWINRPFSGEKKERGSNPFSEIEAVAAFARHSREINPLQEFIISKVSKLSSKCVLDAMVPLEKAVYLNGADEAQEAMEDSRLRLHTRYLLRTEEMQANGYTRYVNSKDILAALARGQGKVSLEELSRPLKIIDANRDLADVLNELIAERRHIAGVSAESADGLCGIITLEDVLEEFMGEMDDEHDRA